MTHLKIVIIEALATLLHTPIQKFQMMVTLRPVIEAVALQIISVKVCSKGAVLI